MAKTNEKADNNNPSFTVRRNGLSENDIITLMANLKRDLKL